MPDLLLRWGEDLRVSASGDLLTVDGDERAKQRIIRRLFTVITAYIYHPEYGGSVPERIGDNVDVPLIQSVIYSQMLLEDAVSQSPPPQVSTREILNGVAVTIVYNATSDGQQKTITFDYPPQNQG